MKSLTRQITLSAAFAAPVIYAVFAVADGGADYRRVIAPEAYGNVVMERTSKAAKDTAPVSFSHWSHRTRHACRVCHTELGFPMEVNAVELKHSDMDSGKFCGACHNGKAAFAASDCAKCHAQADNSNAASKARFDALAKDLPMDYFGNTINWAKAHKLGKIKPSQALTGTAATPAPQKDVVIPVSKFKPSPPDVIFPHTPHTDMLECSSCHDALFKPKKGGNPEMSMMKIISGQYCGVCHGAVSFPLSDCFRCHSQSVPPIAIPSLPKPPSDAAKPAK